MGAATVSLSKKQFNKAFAEFALVAVASVTASGKRVEPHSKESVQKITFYNNKEWCFADKNQVIEKSGSAVCRVALFRPPAALRGGSNNAHTYTNTLWLNGSVCLLTCLSTSSRTNSNTISQMIIQIIYELLSSNCATGLNAHFKQTQL